MSVWEVGKAGLEITLQHLATRDGTRRYKFESSKKPGYA
jgi:hypothetical protein